MVLIKVLITIEERDKPKNNKKQEDLNAAESEIVEIHTTATYARIMPSRVVSPRRIYLHRVAANNVIRKAATP